MRPWREGGGGYEAMEGGGWGGEGGGPEGVGRGGGGGLRPWMDKL